MTAEMIHEIRGIVRLEALRAAIFSCASESLDSQTCELVARVKLQHDCLEASFEYCDSNQNVLAGGTL